MSLEAEIMYCAASGKYWMTQGKNTQAHEMAPIDTDMYCAWRNHVGDVRFYQMGYIFSTNRAKVKEMMEKGMFFEPEDWLWYPLREKGTVPEFLKSLALVIMPGAQRNG